MKPSTAFRIPYNLRPAKQTERRILLDVLKCANEGGLKVSDCRYVGMGGNMFYDFHLMHRFLGINQMVSLERDKDFYPRCEFNCPFDFIKVENKDTATFLAEDNNDAKTIYWFDYDDGFSPEIISDIVTLGTDLLIGGFAFVTVYANPPGILNKRNSEQRLEHFQEHFGEYSVGLTMSDMENVNFSRTVHQILVTAFQNAFAARSDGKFHMLFQVQYKDSSPMITVGGCFCDASHGRDILKRIRIDLPFLLKRKPYLIKNLNITERERQLFDMAATNPRINSKERNSARSLGFKDNELEAYQELLRFLPRYYESII